MLQHINRPFQTTNGGCSLEDFVWLIAGYGAYLQIARRMAVIKRWTEKRCPITKL